MIRVTNGFALNLGFAHKRSIVKGVVRSLILGSAATLVLAAAPAYAELKIGYVNYNALLQDSPDAKVIADALKNEFLPRTRELQTLQQSLKAQRGQADQGRRHHDGRPARQRGQGHPRRRTRTAAQKSEAQDDFNTRRNEELSTLQKSLVEKVRGFAKLQNFDLILADGVIYATNAVDITPQVLSALNAGAAKPAPAPAAPKPPAGK